MTRQSYAMISSAVVVSLLLTSCVTYRKPDGDVLACPECRVVTYIVEDPTAFASREYVEKTRLECKGCQGALITYFKEGKYEHRCSFCDDTPYTCSVTHPGESS